MSETAGSDQFWNGSDQFFTCTPDTCPGPVLPARFLKVSMGAYGPFWQCKKIGFVQTFFFPL